MVAHPSPAVPGLGLADGSLHDVDGLGAGLQGVMLSKDVAHVLHAGLHAFGHEAKHPVGGGEGVRLD